jgi:uncharacterized membrane protein
MAESNEQRHESDGNGTGRAKALLSSLMTKEVALPAAATAAAALAYGARQAGSEAKEKVEHEAEEVGRHGAEGAKQGLGGGVGAKLASKIPGRGGGKQKKTRRLPIQRWTDVAVPVDKAYEQWTKFEEFPKFMHRVVNVKQEGDDKVAWDEKIWFSSRHWEGKVTERRKNRRVAWKTTSGMSHAGLVTFHSLDDNLTRVMVTVDFVPQGVVEKMASGLRFVKRAVQADLARFKAYVEFADVDELEYKARPAEADDGDEREKRRQERREKSRS